MQCEFGLFLYRYNDGHHVWSGKDAFENIDQTKCVGRLIVNQTSQIKSIASKGMPAQMDNSFTCWNSLFCCSAINILAYFRLTTKIHMNESVSTKFVSRLSATYVSNQFLLVCRLSFRSILNDVHVCVSFTYAIECIRNACRTNFDLQTFARISSIRQDLCRFSSRIYNMMNFIIETISYLTGFTITIFLVNDQNNSAEPSNKSHSYGWHNNNNSKNVAAHVKKDSSLMNFADQLNCCMYESSKNGNFKIK